MQTLSKAATQTQGLGLKASSAEYLWSSTSLGERRYDRRSVRDTLPLECAIATSIGCFPFIPPIRPMPQPPSSDSSPNPDRSATGPQGSNSYSAASVPMHVYRELAAELQTTQATLEALETRNRHLTRQNQQLTQQKQQLQAEVVNVVNATLSMRQVAESFQERPDDISLERAKPPTAPKNLQDSPISLPTETSDMPPTAIANGSVSSPDDRAAFSRSSGTRPPFDPASTAPTQLHTEEAGGFERWTPPGFADDPGERSGLWLIVAIAATVVTAFGAGYWLVRPLVQGNQSR